jgi:hypothetical protein
MQLTPTPPPPVPTTTPDGTSNDAIPDSADHDSLSAPYTIPPEVGKCKHPAANQITGPLFHQAHQHQYRKARKSLNLYAYSRCQDLTAKLQGPAQSLLAERSKGLPNRKATKGEWVPRLLAAMEDELLQWLVCAVKTVIQEELSRPAWQQSGFSSGPPALRVFFETWVEQGGDLVKQVTGKVRTERLSAT